MKKPNLRARILSDKEFFEHIFTKVPADKVLEEVQKKYPEAIEYSSFSRRITFRSIIDPCFYVWLDYQLGALTCTVISIPEDDEE